MTNTLKDPLIGTKIGENNRFLIIDKLGNGSFGKVYKCEDLYNTSSDEKYVAIKLFNINENETNNKSIIHDMKFEIEALSKIVFSNNVIKIKDYISTKDTQGIVMELVEGGNDLYKSVDSKRPITYKELKYYLKPIIEGVENIHNLNVIHRDLKPGNIMLNKYKQIKIADVGIGKIKYEDEFLSTKHIYKGTARFAAPEQQFDREAVTGFSESTFNADIYAIGVMMYYWITGEIPYHLFSKVKARGNNDKVNIDIRNNANFNLPLQAQLQSPAIFNDRISSNLENIIIKCLAKDTSIRYQNVKDLLNDFNNMDNTHYRVNCVNPEFQYSKTKKILKNSYWFKIKNFIVGFKWKVALPMALIMGLIPFVSLICLILKK